MKKRLIGITIIGWLIIISNVIYLSIILYASPFRFAKFVADILTSNYIFFSSLPFNLIPLKLLNIFPPPSLIVMFLISTFFLFIGICVLRRINLSRIIVIIMSGILILEQTFNIVKINSKMPILGWVIIALSAIANSIYIYYLARPEVKEQFK